MASVVLVSLTLSGCGAIAKMNDLDCLDASLAAYRARTAEQMGDSVAREQARSKYLAALSSARRSGGIFTDWPAL
jgi:outer membrane murein-binding lipoprotein Lpp